MKKLPPKIAIPTIILIIGSLFACDDQATVPEFDLISQDGEHIGYLRKENEDEFLYSYHDAQCPVVDAYRVTCAFNETDPGAISIHCERDNRDDSGNLHKVEITPNGDLYDSYVVRENNVGEIVAQKKNTRLKLELNDGPITVPQCIAE